MAKKIETVGDAKDALMSVGLKPSFGIVRINAVGPEFEVHGKVPDVELKMMREIKDVLEECKKLEAHPDLAERIEKMHDKVFCWLL